MSVIIKGMDMPHRCDECFFTDSNDECIFLGIDADMDSVDENCPLVEIPSGHGRIIDVGNISSTVGYYELASGEKLEKHFYELEYIQNAPTILEAEGGEE